MRSAGGTDGESALMRIVFSENINIYSGNGRLAKVQVLPLSNEAEEERGLYEKVMDICEQ